jgi:hypothetical protein
MQVVETVAFKVRVPDHVVALADRTMMTLTIFWPTDVNDDGFCYGWDKPMICVAGVLQSRSVSSIRVFFWSSHEDFNQAQDAESILESLRDLQWTHCGSYPRVLGRCTFPGIPGGEKMPSPSLVLDVCNSFVHILLR